ncbi:hypothetical protein ACFVXE_04110 [Streptomyces sp. NPDC058231]|uniref:hypothetical protein n=1 Tax=Streptomyces sp. NPDC058231 TaxID=3346392 RepID=UPI0036E07D04
MQGLCRKGYRPSSAAAQATGGGSDQWDSILPASAVLVKWRLDEDAPTGYWIPNLPPTPSE